MQQKIVNDLLFICKTLQENKVQYLIVGGFAVGLHGYSRMSTDMNGNISQKQDFDFWYNPTYTNYFNLLNALEKLGEDVSKFKAEQTPNPLKSFFKLKSDRFTIDFLPTIIGLEKFITSFKKRNIIKIEGIQIDFICLEDLLINKKTTARPKDIDDINQLNLINKNNK